MPRFPSAQGRLNHEPGFHLSCDENLSKGWGPPLFRFQKLLIDVTCATASSRMDPSHIPF